MLCCPSLFAAAAGNPPRLLECGSRGKRCLLCAGVLRWCVGVFGEEGVRRGARDVGEAAVDVLVEEEL